MIKMEKLERIFVYRHSTPTVHHYQEDYSFVQGKVVLGMLHIQKHVLEGIPKKLKVTVEVIE